MSEEKDTGYGVTLPPSFVNMEARADAPSNVLSDVPDHRNVEIEGYEDGPFDYVNPVIQENDHGVVGDVDEPMLEVNQPVNNSCGVEADGAGGSRRGARTRQKPAWMKDYV